MFRRLYNWWWNRKHANRWVYVAHLIEGRGDAHLIGGVLYLIPKPLRVKYRYIWPR